ncbi:hypothetical protein IHQ68_06930 [Chelatococcus sambhunathii]|uniref:ASCH domain-containing protein n=1 Tax=Chelatococcus sambhunathii TaxID=363953 RepID=A0ABU1DE74_9HYPH|nr:hypothetical protein [Chelatococcus sambhunathii]MDR4306349.1 hypothetical protein [Chelatococcus sambhunathii]
MKVLLSIRPEYAVEIFRGSKLFEYRRVPPRRQSVRTAAVYVTRPVSQIVGEFYFNEIIYGNPDDIWRQTSKYSGISYDFFKEYFRNRQVAYALSIKKAVLYERPVDPYTLFGGFTAPQSYMYLEDGFLAGAEQLQLAF